MDENIIKALNSISVSSCNYQDWLNVGMALKEEGFPCSVWDEWSRNDARYKTGVCESKWASFNGNGNPVKGGTIIELAKRNGFELYKREDKPLDWDSPIQFDGEEACGEKQNLFNPVDQVARYIKALFKPYEIVNWNLNTFKDEDGKWKPTGKGNYMEARELLKKLSKHPEDVSYSIGDYNKEAGGWVRFNPLKSNLDETKKGISNTDISAFRYALVESDSIEIEEQENLFRKLRLPIAIMVNSGGRSLHAIVHIDAESYEEYTQRVVKLYEMLKTNGIEVDKQNKNPSRLSRLPGLERNGKKQYIVAEHIGAESWAEWLEIVEDDALPPIITADYLIDHKPVLPTPLIDGILRQGHKMLMAGDSKAGKSFFLTELAVCFASGIAWAGYPCRKSKVLYINLEIDGNSFNKRILDVYVELQKRLDPKYNEAKDVEKKDILKNIAVWNLRGSAQPLDKLLPKILRAIKGVGYEVIIFDPIYKILTGDENSASDMAFFCNQFDVICDKSGCSVIYCHHHSKGYQGSKKTIDRSSGSGVFARDPDAVLDIIELKVTDDMRAASGVSEYALAFRMTGSVREFRPLKPVNMWWDYPLHIVDHTLDDAPEEGSSEANLSKSSKRTTEGNRKERLEQAFEMCADEEGVAYTKDMAAYLDISEKSVKNYVDEFSEEFVRKNGLIFKKSK